jgi:hypothetical protein
MHPQGLVLNVENSNRISETMFSFFSLYLKSYNFNTGSNAI